MTDISAGDGSVAAPDEIRETLLLSVRRGTREADVALPAGLPVVRLVPLLTDLLDDLEDAHPEAGHGRSGTGTGPHEAPAHRTDGHRAAPTTAHPVELRRVDGRPLHPEADLPAQGVRDGDVLLLTDEDRPLPDPVIDDVAAAVAARTHVATPLPALPLPALALFGALMTGVLAGVPLPAGHRAAPAVLLSVMLLGAVRIADRGRTHTLTAVLAGTACGAAAVGGALAAVLIGGAAATGNLAFPTAGAAAGLVVAAVFVLALVGADGGGASGPAELVAVSVLTAAVPGLIAAASIAAGLVPAAVAGAGLVVAATFAATAAPAVAAGLAGLRIPRVPAPGADLARTDPVEDHSVATPPDAPASTSGTEVPDPTLAARRSARLLAGIIVGTTMLALVGAATGAAPALASLAERGSAPLAAWAGAALAVLVPPLLWLRSRLFADAVPSGALAVGSLAGTVLAAGALMGSLPGTAALVLGLVGAVAAGMLLLAARPLPGPPGPLVGRLLDVADGVLTAAVLPLALGVADAYTLVRSL